MKTNPSTPNKPTRTISLNPTTPEVKIAPRTSTGSSPGGLQKILDSFTSPFRGKEGTPVKSPTVVEEEWNEMTLDSTDIIDWSIQNRLRVECHPGNLMPASIHHDGGDVEQEGLDIFLMGSSSLGPTPRGQWEAARLYWQYPADDRQPLTNEVATLWNSEFSSIPSKFLTSKQDQLTQLANDMVQAVRGPQARLQKLARNIVVDGNEKKRREWQDAFRSLYFAWIQTLESKKAYFYAVLPNQTILFRPQVQSDGVVVPAVVMTTSTPELRRRLNTAGVQLYTLSSQTRFDERTWAQPDNCCKSDEVSTPVRSDLEALRKAQAFGETAGADVSVSTKFGKRSSTRKIPSLFITGDDDCSAFFEIYMNTCDANELPTLLSRRVGGFLHASIKTLNVTHRREQYHSYTGSCTNENNSTLELRGTILPCAVNELVQATAMLMMRDVSTNGNRINPSDNDGDVGSHYFIMKSSRPSVANNSNSSVHLNSVANMTAVSMRVWDASRDEVVTVKWA